MSNSQPVHGNYHGYYTKRLFVRDPRLAVLPPSTFAGARVLDVGCNEGFVTCEIAQSWGAKKVIGVDIDDTLIRAAWKRRRTVWSSQEPSRDNQTLNANMTQTNGRKRRRESVASDDESTSTGRAQADYFPLSCEHMFGPLPILSTCKSGDSTNFPHNVAFRAADWVNSEIPEDKEGYDVILAFSVSKWIHLNGGDEGLKKFFRRIYSVLRPGGTFVFEPQDWDTYAKAKRMDAKLRENAKGLKLRPEDFERILTEIGFGPAQHLGMVGQSGFRRPIDVYIKAG
ncbi:Probable RNA methyltransferase [Sparassis crispa]|uniref:RNA methyltransferase n=1 Tax=Sparassis crispa TaxID=139825 RepID=A0A401GD01_9APHY|nr:Probable RNA methyltransferase [Sparassis crispa]GBE80025.1 Probable RNA methyltransferase [Sparassis crispa]